mmetsp:Transcript_20937/g.48972  ORF Transcript_20937/g.48972 Transcript_20937/m.48972 type:complete len:675 (-) Transcript_20937:94-2118(-)
MDEFQASDPSSVRVEPLEENEFVNSSMQRRFTTLQTRMAETVALSTLSLERLEDSDREKEWLRQEVQALTPFREKCDEFTVQVEELQKANAAYSSKVEALELENACLRQEQAERSVEGVDQSVAERLKRLEQLELEHVRMRGELEGFRLGDQVRRLELRVARVQTESSKLRTRLEETESLLSCIMQVNDYLKSTHQDLVNSLTQARNAISERQQEVDALRWKLCDQEAELQKYRTAAGVDTTPSPLDLYPPLGGDNAPVASSVADVPLTHTSSTTSAAPAGNSGAALLHPLSMQQQHPLARTVAELRETSQYQLIALRTAERNVDALTAANNDLMRRLLSSMAVLRSDDHNYAVEEEYRSAAREAESQRTGSELGLPHWFNKSNGDRDGEDGIPLGCSTSRSSDQRRDSGGVWSSPGNQRLGSFVVRTADHEAIANWIDQFRIRARKATVRYLTSQDSQVLGAELYTSQAFGQLLKRAHAITDDIGREAALLRSGDENGDDPLAIQLSELLVEMAQYVRDMNEMAGAVHKMAMDRMRKYEDGNKKTEPDDSPLSWLKVFRSINENEPQQGIPLGVNGDVDSLWNLVSISGILGDFTLSSFMNDDMSGASKDGDRMRQFLASVDRRISKRRAEENAERQRQGGPNGSGRPYPRRMHMSMFGIMTLVGGESGVAPL